MGIDVVAFIFGAILLSTGLWGGGVSVKDFSIPKIGPVPRLGSISIGILAIIIGISLNENILAIADSNEPTQPVEPAEDTGSTEPAPPTSPAPAPPTAAPSNPGGTPPVEVANPPQAPADSSSSDEAFRVQVAQQLVSVSEEAGLNGYELTHDPYLGSLGDNTQEQISLNLLGQVAYSIIAVCDADCGDIDLELYDEYGNLIDSDVLTDSIPIVEVMPEWDGPFTLNVSMPSCSAPYCYYGIGAFGQ